MIHINDDLALYGQLAPMRTSFDAVALSGELIPQALPLVRATWPGVDLAAWQNFVQFFSSPPLPGTGVLGLRDSTDCLCGILAYQMVWDLEAGPVLAIHLFTAVDLANSPRTAQVLLDVAEMRAIELGCTRIQIRLARDQAGLASRLRQLGLSAGITMVWKDVQPGPPRA
jgi:hypothetical protein